ncbi:MAG TPA: type II secretion system protein [Candidatus Sulfotelmatobacter sp.]|nr:type II secretion system protein [Candidatus Sulfotelmatobacter sp.]
MKSLPKMFRNVKGFTLIELLVVIGILAILLSIVLIAINPARQFGQANNTRRRSDVTQILNAVGAYAADNKGVLPASITTTATTISKAGIDLCASLVTNYIPALPQDPTTGAGTSVTDCTSQYVTGYTIVKDAAGRVTVSAPSAENGEVISNTR